MLPPDKNKKKDKFFTEGELSKSEANAIRKQHGLKKGQSFQISDTDLASFRKGGNVGVTIINAPETKKPEPIQRTEIGKLPTKKATQVGPPNVAPMRVKKDYVINTPAKKEEKFVPTAKTKKLTKGGKPVIGSNIATSVKNIVGKAKFEREKKQAEAGRRGLRGTGEEKSTGRDRLQALKDQKKALKEARRTTNIRGVKKELKDIRQGIKYERKSLRGRTTYRG